MKSTKITLMALAVAALVAGPVLAQADGSNAGGNKTYKIDQQLPVELDVPFPCDTEDVIHLTGNEHWVIGITEDSSGGLHIQMHSNHQGVEGTSDKGRHFNAPGTMNYTWNMKKGVESTLVVNCPLISNQEGQTDEKHIPNWLLHINRHITINPDGTLTSDIFNYHGECVADGPTPKNPNLDCGEGLTDCDSKGPDNS